MLAINDDSTTCPTRFQRRTAQLCPERQIVADSGRGADVDPRRPTSSLEKDQLSPKTCRFSSTTIYNLPGSSSR
ncbi:hypothetical protein GGP41_001366 [Bipolaris sorokiniana]|uniref:Uncharacterized protein n=1 Tax=Cochliobolus sativus TaxID=45130 RepID=A0A8H5Z7Y1_COCSA|nr:hypothetical protein GGP41_001366 [Bipolaris sorokiniana]